MMIVERDSRATLINIFHTAPPRQRQVIETWLAVGGPIEREPGFVSAALHRSTDRTRLINYAQWESAAAWESATARYGPEFARFHGLATTDPHLFEVIHLSAPPTTAASPLPIGDEGGPAIMINVFSTDPERQQRLIDTWLEVGEPFTHQAGFIAAALHRSVDGTRVVNYAHWRNAADWETLVAQRGPEFARFRPLGASDPHLYEVVYLSERVRP